VIVSEYRKDKRFSQSDVKKYLNLSPEHFFEQYRNKSAPTESMIFGAALHHKILESQSWSEFYCLDLWSKRRAGKDYTAHKKELAEDAEDRTIIKVGTEGANDKSFSTMSDIHSWILKYYPKLLSHAKNKNEHSLYGEINGVQVKGQMDIYREGIGILDLKFTEFNIDTDHKLNKLVIDGRFDIQAYMYIELVNQNYGLTVPFHFKVISWKDKPICMRTVEISWAKTPEILENAKMQVENALFEMEQYRNVEEFPLNKEIYIPRIPDYIYGEK